MNMTDASHDCTQRRRATATTRLSRFVAHPNRRSMHTRTPDQYSTQQSHHKQDTTTNHLQQPALHAAVDCVCMSTAQ